MHVQSCAAHACMTKSMRCSLAGCRWICTDACAGVRCACMHDNLYQVPPGGMEMEITELRSRMAQASLSGQGQLDKFWPPAECTSFIWPLGVKKINEVGVCKAGNSLFLEL